MANIFINIKRAITEISLFCKHSIKVEFSLLDLPKVTNQEGRGKLSPSWEGSFRVKSVVWWFTRRKILRISPNSLLNSKHESHSQ